MAGWLDGWMDLDGIEPERCRGARTFWDRGILEAPCEDQYEGSRGP